MHRVISISLTAAIIIMTLISCGGGGSSAGIGGTGVTSSGAISGFGSIFVNGVRYDTNNASVDGDLSQVADLELGMVVTVRGEVNTANNTGTANSINVDIELKGPVANAPVLDINNNTKTFTILGRSIVASSGITVFAGTGFSFDSISLNDVIEASGYLDANGRLQATRLEKTGTLNLGSTTVEVNGIVSATSNASFILLVDNTSLTINNPNGLTVAGGISAGVELEVKGNLSTAIEIRASEIDLDDDLFDNNDTEIEIEGYISNYVSDSNFMVNGQAVNAGSATLSPMALNLGNNVKVEIEGTLSNGLLEAATVNARSGSIRIFTNVDSVDPGNNQVTMEYAGQTTVPVSVNNQTKFEDDVGSGSLTLAGIAAGDFLEILAIDVNGTILATEIKRKVDEADRETILRGNVTNINTNTAGQEMLTILGVTYSTDPGTEFEIADMDKTRSEFFSTVSVGSNVSIKEKKSSFVIDGIAEKMELKN